MEFNHEQKFKEAIKILEEKGYSVIDTVFPYIKNDNSPNSRDNVLLIVFMMWNYPKTAPTGFDILIDKEDFVVEIYKNWGDDDLFTLGCFIIELLNWANDLPYVRKG